MNIAHTTLKARPGTAPGRVSLVRRAVLCVVLGCVSLGASHAFAGDKERREDRQERREERREERRDERREQPRADQRQFDARAFEQRAEEQRRQLQVQQERNSQNARSGRLTPDERRDLRRQINEAGMDLYPNTPRR
jgi:hypothetical protein